MVFPAGPVAADVTGCAKTPKWHFGRTKKGFSDPSPPKKTRHIETVEVVFPGSPAGEEFSHSLVRRRSGLALASASSRRRLRLTMYASAARCRGDGKSARRRSSFARTASANLTADIS